jgi:putative phage-type endonuclease
MTATARPIPVVQNTPEWLEARRDHIGSSDIPTITGSNPYGGSVYEMWALKARVIDEVEIDEATAEMFALGHAMEPVIARRYTEVTGRPLRRARRLLESKAIPWASASLDRVSAVKGERRIVEIKWAPHRRWDDGPEPVPANVQDQVQWQMLVTGYPVADVAVLSGSKVSYHEVDSDPEYQADLVKIATWFRGLVETRTPPTVDGTESTRSAIARLYPDDDGILLPASPEWDTLAASWRAAQLDFDRVEERLGAIKNEVRLLLEAHAGVEGDAYRITYRKTKPSRKTDWRAAYARLADALEDAGKGTAAEWLEYAADRWTTETSGSRRLLPKWKGDQ